MRLLVALRDQVVLEDDLFEAFWPDKAPAAGPYAKNRLGVVATVSDTDTLLNHAPAHLRLQS